MSETTSSSAGGSMGNWS